MHHAALLPRQMECYCSYLSLEFRLKLHHTQMLYQHVSVHGHGPNGECSKLHLFNYLHVMYLVALSASQPAWHESATDGSGIWKDADADNDSCGMMWGTCLCPELNSGPPVTQLTVAQHTSFTASRRFELWSVVLPTCNGAMCTEIDTEHKTTRNCENVNEIQLITEWNLTSPVFLKSKFLTPGSGLTLAHIAAPVQWSSYSSHAIHSKDGDCNVHQPQ